MDTRFIVIPVILIILIAIEVDNRNFLYRNFAESDLKGYHSPFFALIACVVIFFALFFLFPSHNNDYDELKEKYDNLSSSVDLAIDDAITIKWYLNGEENITKEQADRSASDLIDLLNSVR